MLKLNLHVYKCLTHSLAYSAELSSFGLNQLEASILHTLPLTMELLQTLFTTEKSYHFGSFPQAEEIKNLPNCVLFSVFSAMKMAARFLCQTMQENS